MEMVRRMGVKPADPASVPVGGRADLDDDAARRDLAQHGGILGDVRAMADARHAKQVDGIDRGGGRAGLGGMAGESEPGRPRDAERRGENGEVGIEDLIAGQIEADHPAPGKTRRGAGDGDVRLGIVEPQRADHSARCHTGRLRPLR